MGGAPAQPARSSRTTRSSGGVLTLALSMVLSWVARHLWARDQRDGPPAGPRPGPQLSRVTLVVAAALVGIPCALVTMLLAAYALLFAVHGVSLLF